jgi:hypothetical protein
VLSEMIKHHVKEEEQRGGMFAKARDSEMDLVALGERMQQRKSEVMGEEQRAKEGAPRGRRGKIPAALLGRNGRGQPFGTRGRS